MSAHGPRLQSRVGSLLIVVLLVGSLVAPAFAGSAAASTTTTAADDGTIDGSFDGTCDSKLKFAFPISCPVGNEPEPVDTDQGTSEIKTDIHISSQGIHESQKQTQITYENYIQDTQTLASLEARDAIATAYENNESISEAQADATTAIRDYYSVHQKNILAEMNADTAQLRYYVNATHQDSNISDSFIVMWAMNHDGSNNQYVGHDLHPNPSEQNITLLNGSTESVQTWDFEYQYDKDTTAGTENNSITFNPVSDYSESNDEFTWSVAAETVHYDGGLQLSSHADANLKSETAYDYRIMMQLWTDLAQQANEVDSAYPQDIAENMYAKMDSGELDPNDVRGAEGMVRYLSGDSTEGESLELALRHALDLEHPDAMDSEMTIDFAGETDRERISYEDGSVEYNYTTVNTTYEGLLFASGFPNGTAETGVEYNVSNFDGTPSMLTADGEVRMYSGNFTIQEIYDGDGDAVESMDYGGPEYGTYNEDEFIQALENASAERAEIVIEDDDSSSVDLGIPNPFGGSGGAIVGLAIVGIVGLLVVGVVTDMVPGVGN